MRIRTAAHPPAARDDTRARILAAARDLFFEKGYHATGLAEILSRAQANSGSFYHFFESKEAVLRAVLEHYVEALHPELLAPIYARVADPIQRVFALLEQYRAAILATSYGYACPIGRVALEVEPDMEHVHRGVAENFTAWRNAVRDNLLLARARFPAGCDLDRLAAFVLTVMEGAVMQSRAYKSIEPFDASVDVLRDYFCRMGVRTLKPPRQGAKRRARRPADRRDRRRER